MQLGETRIRGNSLLVCLRGGDRDDRSRRHRAAESTSSRTWCAGSATESSPERMTRGSWTTTSALLTGLGSDRPGGLPRLVLVGLRGCRVGTSARVPRALRRRCDRPRPGLRPPGIDRCQIRGNRVAGRRRQRDRDPHARPLRAVADNLSPHIGGGGVVMARQGSADVLAGRAQPDPQRRAARDGEGQTAAVISSPPSRDVAVTHNTIDGVGLEASGAAARRHRDHRMRLGPHRREHRHRRGPPDQFLGISARHRRARPLPARGRARQQRASG